MLEGPPGIGLRRDKDDAKDACDDNVKLSIGDGSNHAMMIGIAGIVMQPHVQRGTGRHRENRNLRCDKACDNQPGQGGRLVSSVHRILVSLAQLPGPVNSVFLLLCHFLAPQVHRLFYLRNSAIFSPNYYYCDAWKMSACNSSADRPSLWVRCRFGIRNGRTRAGETGLNDPRTRFAAKDELHFMSRGRSLYCDDI
jgi:hypothetical protein